MLITESRDDAEVLVVIVVREKRMDGEEKA